MRARRPKYSSIRGPVTLFIVILVLIITLTVLWNVALVQDYSLFREMALETGAFHWTLIAVGSTLFLTIIVLSSILGAQLIARTRWNQRQSRFVASVTHELNSPLSAIKLFAQTLQGSGVDDADRLRFVGKILSEVERLTRIIGNILRAAEIDNRGEMLPVALKTVALHGYVQEYAEEVRALRGGELEMSVKGDQTATVDIDPMMFRQVLNNLVDNTIRHGRGTPARLELRITRMDAQVELRATDNGVGIPPDRLESVFLPFHRIPRSGELPALGGVGIGLFVVRSIVQAHGGEVGAESTGPGEGVTVWIRLPADAGSGEVA